MDEFDWPIVGFVGVDIETSAQWSGLREVQPLFSRSPYEEWCRLFRRVCAADDTLSWMGAGFVRCTPGEIDRVAARLAEVTTATNDAFRAMLARALVDEPDATRDLIAIDGSIAASEDGVGYLCGFTSRV